MEINNKQTARIMPRYDGKASLLITYDGHSVKKVPDDAQIHICKANKVVNFVRLKPYNFEAVFREKFNINQ